jgi:hypothetical protein
VTVGTGASSCLGVDGEIAFVELGA